MLSQEEFCTKIIDAYYHSPSSSDTSESKAEKARFLSDHLCSDEILYFGLDYRQCASMQHAACADRFFDPFYNRSSTFTNSYYTRIDNYFSTMNANHDYQQQEVNVAYWCCPGFFCPKWMTCMIPCPDGSYCPPPNTVKDIPVLSPCPAGFYCTSPIISEPIVCPEKHYCPTGSSSPKVCTSILPRWDVCKAQSTEDVIFYQTLLVALLSLVSIIIVGAILQNIWMNPLSATSFRSTKIGNLGSKNQISVSNVNSNQSNEQMVLSVDAVVLHDARIWRNDQLVFTLFPSLLQSPHFSDKKDVSDIEKKMSPNYFLLRPGITACVGLSGAGKTTFLNVLAERSKLLYQLNGSVYYHYQNLFQSFPIKSVTQKEKNYQKKISYRTFMKHFGQEVGYVTQHSAKTLLFYQPLTVWESLWFHVRLRKGYKRWPTEALLLSHVMFWLEQMKLLSRSSLLTQMVSSLSGGEMKRLSLAMELICEPCVLYMDEPTSGLDAQTAEDVLFTLQQFSRGASSAIGQSQNVHNPAFPVEDEHRTKDITIPRIVLMVVHQPSHEISYRYFDRIIGFYTSSVTSSNASSSSCSFSVGTKSGRGSADGQVIDEVHIDDHDNHVAISKACNDSSKEDYKQTGSADSEDTISISMPSRWSKEDNILSRNSSDINYPFNLCSAFVVPGQTAFLDLPAKRLLRSAVEGKITHMNADASNDGDPIASELQELLEQEENCLQYIGDIPEVIVHQRVNMMDNYLLSLSLKTIEPSFVLMDYLAHPLQVFALAEKHAQQLQSVSIFTVVLETLLSCFYLYPFYFTTRSLYAHDLDVSHSQFDRVFSVFHYWMTVGDQIWVSWLRCATISIHSFGEIWVWNLCLGMVFGFALGYFHRSLSDMSSATVTQIPSAHYLLALAVSLVGVQAGIRLRRVGYPAVHHRGSSNGGSKNGSIRSKTNNIAKETQNMVQNDEELGSVLGTFDKKENRSAVDPSEKQNGVSISFMSFISNSSGRSDGHDTIHNHLNNRKPCRNSDSSQFTGYSYEGITGIHQPAVYIGECLFEGLWLAAVVLCLLWWFRAQAQSMSPWAPQFVLLYSVGLAATSVGHALVIPRTDLRVICWMLLVSLYTIVIGVCATVLSILFRLIKLIFMQIVQRTKFDIFGERTKKHVSFNTNRPKTHFAQWFASGSGSGSGSSGEVGTWGIYLNLFFALLAGFTPQARDWLIETSTSSSSSSSASSSWESNFGLVDEHGHIMSQFDPGQNHSHREFLFQTNRSHAMTGRYQLTSLHQKVPSRTDTLAVGPSSDVVEFQLGSSVFFTTDFASYDFIGNTSLTYVLASSSSTNPSETYSSVQTFHTRSPYNIYPIYHSKHQLYSGNHNWNRAQLISLSSYLAPAFQGLLLLELQSLFPLSIPRYVENPVNSKNPRNWYESHSYTGFHANSLAAGWAKQAWYGFNSIGNCEYLNYRIPLQPVDVASAATGNERQYVGKIHKLVCPFHDPTLISKEGNVIDVWTPVLYYTTIILIYMLIIRVLFVILWSFVGYAVAPGEKLRHLWKYIVWRWNTSSLQHK